MDAVLQSFLRSSLCFDLGDQLCPIMVGTDDRTHCPRLRSQSSVLTEETFLRIIAHKQAEISVQLFQDWGFQKGE